MSRRQRKLLAQRRRVESQRRYAASLRRAAAGGSGLAVVATLLSGTAAQAAPATVEVTNDSGTPAGSNAATQMYGSQETLADAIAYADNNYAAGTTKVTFASDLSGSTGQTIKLNYHDDQTFDVTEPITIDGSGANVTIDGGYGDGSALYDEIFHVYEPSSWPAGATATFNDLTITGGGYNNSYGSSDGSAIIADVAPVTVSGSTIENNHGAYAALTSRNGPLTVIDSTITGNTGHWGGGIYVYRSGSSLTLEDSTVTGNVATWPAGGVGAINGVSSVTISGSAITDNSATYGGAAGGFEASYGVGTVSVTGSTISGNIAPYGTGGARIQASTISSVENSTVAENYGDNAGGVDIQVQPGYTATLVGDTITGNATHATSGYAGGITLDRSGGGSLAIDDTIDEGNTQGGSFDGGTGAIVAGSAESDVYSGDANGGSPVDGISSSFSLIGNTGNIDPSGTATLTAGTGDQLTNGAAVLNPGLSPLRIVAPGKPQVMVPQAGSPALDAGDAAGFAGAVGDGFKTDELGTARPTLLGWSASLPGDGTDIGAVELGALEIPTPAVSGLSPGSGAAGTTITINGSGFWGTPTVTVGGVAATNVTLVSPTQITAQVPAGVSGSVDVLVKTGSGTSTATAADKFSYPVTSTTPPLIPTPRSRTITVGDQQLTLTIPAGTFAKGSRVKLKLTDHKLKHGAKAKVKQVVFTLGKHKLTVHGGNASKSISTSGLSGHKTLQARVTLTETTGKGKHRHTRRINSSIKLTITIG